MARDGERGRGDWKARLGSRNSGPYAGDSGDSGPVDIAAVRRDDALIDAIASDGQVQTDSPEEFQLATLLADWRAELIEPPLPSTPDIDAVVAAVNQEIGARQVRINAQSSGRLRLLRPIAGTAAALALVFGGMTAFSYNAEPGDPLWRVKEVVFSEQAQTTVVQRANTQMVEAQAMLSQGNQRQLSQDDKQQAGQSYLAAADNVNQVNDADKRNDLLAQLDVLYQELQRVAPDVAAKIPRPIPDPTDEPSTSTTTPPKQTVSPLSVNPSVTGTNPGTNPSGSATPEPTDPTEPTDPSEPTTTAPTTGPAQPTTTQPTVATPTTVASPTVVEPPVEPPPFQPTSGVPAEPGSSAPTVPDPGSIVIPTESTGITGSGI